jgi:hypothetical protein
MDQLLEQHPMRVDITERPIMLFMGINEPTRKMKSGWMFEEMFGATLQWLNEEGCVDSAGLNPRDSVRLTTKGLAVLNAMPPNLGGKSIGDSIADAKSSDAPDPRNRIAAIFGDFIGASAASYIKSVASGE